MVLLAHDRPWWGFPEWRDYHRENPSPKSEAQYDYIKGVERIRDLTDSEHWYALAYDNVVLGVGK
jgi:hypothetical protein